MGFARRPVLAVFERPPLDGAAAALWAALGAAGDARQLVAGADGAPVARESDVEALVAAAQRAARELAPSALILFDGPVARRALPALHGAGAPVVLALDAAAAPADFPWGRRPGPGLKGPAYPAEVWSFGEREPLDLPREFLPGSVHRATAPEKRWVARRLAAVAGAATPARRRALTSVIIPCWNGLEDTKICLERLRRWTPEPFEALIVDNGSTDGTAAYVRALKDKRLRLIRNEKNLGFARAVNQGLEAARGEYSLWLNTDCFVTPGWLGRLVDVLERAPWVGAVGPHTNETSGVQKVERPGYSGIEGLDAFSGAWALSRAGRAQWVHRLVGFCFLHRTSLVQTIGGLDERFGLGCYEDLDFCLRARQAGFELFLAEDVFVHHHGHATFDSNRVDFMVQVRANREIFIEKWCRKSLEYLDEVDQPLATTPSARARPI